MQCPTRNCPLRAVYCYATNNLRLKDEHHHAGTTTPKKIKRKMVRRSGINENEPYSTESTSEGTCLVPSTSGNAPTSENTSTPKVASNTGIASKNEYSLKKNRSRPRDDGMYV